MLRDSLDGVAGLPLEPPRDMPELDERWQDRVDERAAARLRQREQDPVCPHCDDIQQDPLHVVAGPHADESTVLSCQRCEGWFVVYEMPEPRYVRPCPAKGCDGGVIYAGRASFDTGDATLTGGEDFETCGMCGGLGQVGA